MVGSTSRFAKTDIYTVIRKKDGVKITVFGRRKPLQAQKTTSAIIDQSNRLDLLAFDAYKDTRKYWAICDSNIEPSPFDLLKRSGEQIVLPSSGDVKTYV